MRRDATKHGARPALALLSLLSITIPAIALPSPSPPAAREAQGFMVGTVRAIDTKARTLEVVTGVGHAVRLMRMQVSRDCVIKDARKAAQLGNIRRGRIVRVQYMVAAQVREGRVQRTALSIEGLPTEGTGGAR